MPPLVPQSMKWMPAAVSSRARRMVSWKLELPPSMMMSPGVEQAHGTCRSASSVTWPDGTMSQTTRRGC